MADVIGKRTPKTLSLKKNEALKTWQFLRALRRF